jgi:signal peptidase I
MSIIPKNKLTEAGQKFELLKIASSTMLLLFAIIVATLVHTYFVQPYHSDILIEKSLLIGDFLFVSKINLWR